MITNRGYELIIECTLPIPMQDSEGNTLLNDDNTVKTVEETVQLHLDTIQERDITSSAKIATQPLFNGNTLSDHMYRDPDSYQVSGTFSVFGAYRDDERNYAYVPGTNINGDRLTNIQKTFEYIKDNAIICNLMTYVSGQEGSSRFKQRPSMAIESITWKEMESSMSYSFTFKEILALSWDNAAIEIKIAEDNKSDLSLPQAQNLGQIWLKDLIQDGSPLTLWDRVIIGCLCENEIYIKQIVIMCAEAFMNDPDKLYAAIFSDIANYSELYKAELAKKAEEQYKSYVAGNVAMGGVIGIGLGLQAADIILSISASVATASIIASGVSLAGGTVAAGSSGGPVGLIVGVVIGVCILLGCVIAEVITQRQKNKKSFKLIAGLEQFNNFTFDSKKVQSMSIEEKRQNIFKFLKQTNASVNTAEMQRLINFLEECNVELNQIANNCKFYVITNDTTDNIDSECIINIGGTTHKLTFKNKKEYKDVEFSTGTVKTFERNKVEVGAEVYSQTSETQYELLDGRNGTARNLYETTKVCESFDQMSIENALFIDKTRAYEVYLYNAQLEPSIINQVIMFGIQNKEEIAKEIGSTSSITMMTDATKYMLAAYLKEATKMSNHMLVVSYGSFQNNINNLKDKIAKMVAKLEV